MRTNNDMSLPKKLFKGGSVTSPPFPIDIWGHDLEHHNIIMRRRFALISPQALCWGAGEGSQAAKSVGQFLSDAGIILIAEGLTRIVINGKKYLDEMHDSGPLPSGCAKTIDSHHGRARRRFGLPGPSTIHAARAARPKVAPPLN